MSDYQKFHYSLTMAYARRVISANQLKMLLDIYKRG